MHDFDFVLCGPALLPDDTIVESTLRLSRGAIAGVSAGPDPGADLAVEGGFILPGFIDLQINGGFGYDFTQDGASVAAVSDRLPATGVTAFLPTVITSPFEAYPQRLQEIAGGAREANAAQVLGVHLEGPYLNPARAGAHDPTLLRAIDLTEMLSWADPALVRIVTLAPELPGALESIRTLRQRGILVSAGHSDATFAEAQAGFEAGISWGTHLFNAMSPLHHREPGLSGALLLSDIPCGLIADGIHVHPALVDLTFKAKGAGGLALVTDAMAALGMPPGEYHLGKRLVQVSADRAQLADGTLAGSLLRMDTALRNMLAFTGCSLAEASAMAARTPARLLGLERKGRIAPGCDADLVVLDHDLAVTHTFVNGRLLYSRDNTNR